MDTDLIKVMENAARKKPAKVVICEGWDERCLQAAADVLKSRLAKIVLLGEPALISRKAAALGVDISGAEIVDFKGSELAPRLAKMLAEARKHKGMTLPQAKQLLQDENYFGCMYAFAGYADAVAGSAIGPTAALMRPALQILRQEGKIASEVAVMHHRGKVFFTSDSSMNIQPDASQLAQIALNAAECAKAFSIEPKVALLSFSTKGSGGDNAQTQLVRDAVTIVKETDPSLLVDGELQLDAAVSPAVAQRKCPDSPLHGDANVLIFPDLNAGNIFCHAMLQFSDMELDFTLMKGLAKPVAILGRSTPLQAVRNMIVSCCMQANMP